MAWTNFDRSPTEDEIGFVYLIVNETKDRYYIGKKSFWSTVTRPPLKGQTKKRVVTQESDWQKYYGSNKELLADRKAGDVMTRHIIRICYSKAEVSYHEAKTILRMDALLDERFYNGWLDYTGRSNMLRGLQPDSLPAMHPLNMANCGDEVVLR